MVMFLLILLVTSGGAVGSDVLTPDYDTQSFSGTSFSQSYPSCFTEEITWSIEESIDMIVGVESLYSCQALCLQSSNCHQFSYYTEQAMALKLACFLYNHPSTEYPCLNCVSGPQACTCSGYYSCQILENNFVGEFSNVGKETLCQDHCSKTDQCSFYTWFEEDLFPNLCLMFSSCDEKEFNCNSCHSGPTHCDNISIITSTTTTSPIVTSTSTTTSPYLSCFDEDITWSSDEISSMFPGIYNATSCQDYCQNNTNICSHFTHYSSDAEPLHNVCILFLDPSTSTPCTHCVSGPVSCVCGAQFACEVEDGNLVDVITSVQNENLCQEECVQSPICNFYTYFDIVAHPFRQTCFLFSSCDKVDYSCQRCVSGPDDCTNIIYISTLHPTSPSTSTTTTPTTTTTFMSTTTATCANLPESQIHGDWFCPDYKEIVTCHLECHPGYVSNNGTVITCQRGEWSSAPTCVTAVALITGREYPSPHNTVEIYGEGIHKKMPNLPDDRRYHSLELVDAVVLLCGGDDTRTSCLVFTASQQWTRHSTTTSPRYVHSSVSMLGQLHLLGGGGSRSTTEQLTASSQQWFVGWDLFEDTRYACAVNIDPEVFIVTGGYYRSSSVVAYNGTSGAATRLQDLITPRYGHGCVYVRDSDNGLRGVVVAGGYSSDYTDLSEIYDLALGEWISTGKLTTRRYGVRMVVLGQDILAMGGYDGHHLSIVDSFNLTTKKWTATEEMMEARCMHAVTGVPPNAVGIVEN